MNEAISYIRFSSKRQADGRSLARQTEQAQRLCQREKLALRDLTFQDLGVSSFRGENKDIGALGQLSRALQDGKIKRGTTLIVESFDRLSRQTARKALRLIEELIEGGLVIRTISPDRRYDLKSLDDPFNLMEMLFVFVRANEESETKSKRSSYSWRSRQTAAREHGQPITGKTPAWLKVVDGEYQIVEEKAEPVRQIIRWSASGLGAVAILKRLHDAKLPNPATGEPKWSLAYVQLLMTDKRLIGLYTPYGRKKQAGESFKLFPPIVSEELFNRAQALVRGRRRVKSKPSADGFVNVLVGLVFDPVTKTRYIIDKKNRDGKRFLRTMASRNKQAPYRSVDYVEVVKAVCGSFFKHRLDRNSTDVVEPKSKRLKDKLEGLEKRIKNYKQRVKQKPDFTSLLDLLYEAETEYKRVAAELEAESDSEVLSTPANVDWQEMIAKYKRGEYGEDARQVLNSFIHRIEIRTKEYWRWQIGIIDCQHKFKGGGTVRRITHWQQIPVDRRAEYLLDGLNVTAKFHKEVETKIADEWELQIVYDSNGFRCGRVPFVTF